MLFANRLPSFKLKCRGCILARIFGRIPLHSQQDYKKALSPSLSSPLSSFLSEAYDSERFKENVINLIWHDERRPELIVKNEYWSLVRWDGGG